MDDCKILALFESRDEYAVLETDEKYGRYCFSIAINLLGDAREAEEVVNDTYYRTWTSIPPEKPKNLKAYLGKIARHLAINRIEASGAEKRRSALTLVFEELAEVLSVEEESHLDKIALQDALKHFLQKLSKEDRILFVKRYWYNETVHTLARESSLSYSAVKTRLHRIRQQLKIHLQNEGVLEKETL